MSRTNNSIRNIIFAIIGQAVGLFASFVARKVFVVVLSSEYLGLSGLLSNIISILTLAELGVGTSIIYSLYKPLAENDHEKIKSLMRLYKNAYTIIGLVVLATGASLTPILGFFINDMPDIPGIRIIYLLFVGNAGISYFFSYRRELIIADQKRYIATIYRYIFFVALNIGQIIILHITKNYFLFLCLQIFFTLVENIMISIKSNKMFPYLKEKNIASLDKADVNKIKKNVAAMMFHKVGGIIVNGTDNIIISKFINIVAVGVYSNYTLILSAINILTGVLSSSVTASIGNLFVNADDKKKQEVFNNIFFISSMIFGVVCICLFNLLNLFIRFWLGNEYVLGGFTVFIIVFNFYIKLMRIPSLTMRDTAGLFWNDRFKPLFESAINLIASLCLVRYFGVAGVLMGTIVSTLTTCFWVEPYVLYKYGLHTNLSAYFLRYAIYMAVTLAGGALSWFLCLFIGGSGIIALLLKGIISVAVFGVMCIVVFSRRPEFHFAFKLIQKILPFKKNSA